eukprot:gnl/MRDRNA2_/MRDRNA2_294335_c0_seq1.p1 gnl/MRDRNA2_/MRDRNA2_294335_c0~~gnl/MRDRNA2_/MRDRNA2_294335_c0_seq1.p1  ORF type:complete len:246 (-),score=50.07 gnl/MRDRNA2_/MRDRNA2_294335_c0_seq1:18-755(-)
MDASWRHALETVLDSKSLAQLEKEIACEVQEAQEDALPFALFAEEEDDTVGSAAAVAAELQTTPELRSLQVGHIPEKFRSLAWFQIFRPGGMPIPIVLGASKRGHGDVVWAAADFCAKALIQGDIGPIAGRRILELGAGVGLPSCTALRCGASVVASDLLDAARMQALATTLALNLKVVESAEFNSTSGHTRRARVVSHSWGESCADLCVEGRFDLILCCDCLYVPASHGPLLDTIVVTDHELEG